MFNKSAFKKLAKKHPEIVMIPCDCGSYIKKIDNFTCKKCGKNIDQKTFFEALYHVGSDVADTGYKYTWYQYAFMILWLCVVLYGCYDAYVNPD